MNKKMGSHTLTLVGIIFLTQSVSLQQLPKTAPRDTKEVRYTITERTSTTL